MFFKVVQKFFKVPVASLTFALKSVRLLLNARMAHNLKIVTLSETLIKVVAVLKHKRVLFEKYWHPIRIRRLKVIIFYSVVCIRYENKLFLSLICNVMVILQLKTRLRLFLRVGKLYFHELNRVRSGNNGQRKLSLVNTAYIF